MAFLKKNSPGCGCCSPPCNCTNVTTTDCSPDVSKYLFSVSGLTNDNCSSCDLWNGDWELCWKGSDTWATNDYNGTECSHSSGDPLWRLIRSGGFYNLQMLGTSFYWKLATGSWNCSSTNTLTLNTPLPSPAPCGTLPNTIDVVPCMSECPACTGDTFPDSIQIDFSGITAYNCLGFGQGCVEQLNDTFILDNVSGKCAVYEVFPASFLLCGSGRLPYPQVTAQALLDGANYKWRVKLWLQPDGSHPPDFEYALYEWSSGSAFDCSVSRSLSYVSTYSAYFRYCVYSSSSCTLTPL